MATTDVYLSSVGYLATYTSNGGVFTTGAVTPRAGRPTALFSTYSQAVYWKFQLPALLSGATISQIDFWGNVTSTDGISGTVVDAFLSSNQTSSFLSSEIGPLPPGVLTGTPTTFLTLGYSTVGLIGNPPWTANNWIIVRGRIIRSSYAVKTSYYAATFSTSAPSGSFLRVTYTPPIVAATDYNNLYTFTA